MRCQRDGISHNACNVLGASMPDQTSRFSHLSCHLTDMSFSKIRGNPKGNVISVVSLFLVLVSLHALQPKFAVMESSIRGIYLLEIELGLGKTAIRSSKNDNICYILQTRKTIIQQSSKTDDLELHTKYWPWPTCYRKMLSLEILCWGNGSQHVSHHTQDRKTMEARRIVELTEPLNRRSAARKVNLWESTRRCHFQHSR